jgi:hypothetical protein
MGIPKILVLVLTALMTGTAFAKTLTCDFDGGTVLLYGYYQAKCVEPETAQVYILETQGLMLGFGFTVTAGDAVLDCPGTPADTDISGEYGGVFNGYDATLLPLLLTLGGRRVRNGERSCTLKGAQIGFDYNIPLYAPIRIFKNH